MTVQEGGEALMSRQVYQFFEEDIDKKKKLVRFDPDKPQAFF